jgi:hypothetical protein
MKQFKAEKIHEKDLRSYIKKILFSSQKLVSLYENTLLARMGYLFYLVDRQWDSTINQDLK